MAVWLFCAVALALSGLSAGVSVCISANAWSCRECIQVSKSCGWCSDESFPWSTGSKALRCDDVQSLLARNCPPGKIVNPLGIVNIEKNLPMSDHTKGSPEKLTAEQIIQIQPQQLNVTLRPGEPQTFSLKFKRAEDYPIDLYYLMDLSSSMKDDLENVKNLGADLVAEMQKITSDFRIGFGSIVKTAQTLPGDPCPGTQNCPGPFSFKNVLKLTDKGEDFTRLVSQQQISDSLDSALGGSNAIMQVALCEEQIGWRDATRLLVLSTDAALHLAGLSTPLPLPQGGQCQLENDTYTSDGQDHPSLIQLLRTVLNHNIQTIFAVTENVLPAYEELKNHFPKFAVGSLTSNSSNVIQLIVDAYNSLSSEVVLKNSRLPKGVSISYKSLCKDGEEEIGENARKCSNISISDEVSFEITIAAQKCPQLGKAEVIKIYPLGFSEGVEVALNFICECHCSAQREHQSEKCNAAGTLECGACHCYPGLIGAQCDCDLSTMDDPDTLMRCTRGSDLAVCSNNGECVCGTCECKKRDNPEERYSGQFCECDNFNCDRSNNRLCGGHGRCECRKCICEANWTGSACDCSLDLTTCLAKNGQICNGRGICECGSCKCTDPKFQGPTCETCPTCPGTCTQHKDCVQCRAFGAGLKVGSCDRDCSYFNMIKVMDRDKLPQPSDNSRPLTHCKERDENDCWYYYTYSVHEDGTKEVHVVQTQDCPKVSLLDYLG